MTISKEKNNERKGKEKPGISYEKVMFIKDTLSKSGN